MANFIGGIISITLGVIVLANVFMTTVHTTNTATWTASEVANLKGLPFRSTVMGRSRFSWCYRYPLWNSQRLWCNVRQ